MDFDDAALRRAFADQAAVVSAKAAGIGDLSVTTRLPGWSCAVLVGHISSGVEALWRWHAAGAGDGVELDAVTYWDPVASIAETNSDWAITYAGRRTADQLRAGLVDAVTRAVAYVDQTDSASPIVVPIGSAWLRFDQFLATRVLELTVHGLDLAATSATSGADPAPDPTAAAITAAVLDARLDGPRPADLVDDIAWIEASTGRVGHADDRLPVMG